MSESIKVWSQASSAADMQNACCCRCRSTLWIGNWLVEGWIRLEVVSAVCEQVALYICTEDDEIHRGLDPQLYLALDGGLCAEGKGGRRKASAPAYYMRTSTSFFHLRAPTQVDNTTAAQSYTMRDFTASLPPEVLGLILRYVGISKLIRRFV